MGGIQGDDPFLDCGHYPGLGRSLIAQVAMTLYRGMRVNVIGAGKSGLAAARLLHSLGMKVFVSEKGRLMAKLPAGIASESGGNTERALRADLLIRSPGVPSHLSILKKAAARHIPLWSEIELASRYARSRNIIAITGTNGKTTTTTLVGKLFKSGGRKTFVGGNIGTPFADFARRTMPSSVVVLETSSYQLEDIQEFHPRISAILNVTPDHLEHHGSMRAYAKAKARIYENQTKKDICVLNADDPVCRRWITSCPARVILFSRKKSLRSGVWFAKGMLHYRWAGKSGQWRLKTKLPGPHNIENILASVAIGLAGQLSPRGMQRVLERFPGVEHRLEHVRTLDGVDYVNDSKATNVDSTRVALASFDRPILLIAGGEGKGSPYTPLRALVKKQVRSLLLIGDDAPAIRRELGDLVPSEMLGTMQKAVRRARLLAQRGEVVLLSPACASFDQYQNYEHRGRDFKALVRKLR
jgi:UDP-N-acetylmuramoylalanine--D-glutamate ligase